MTARHDDNNGKVQSAVERAAIVEYQAAIEALGKFAPGSLVYGWVEKRVTKAVSMLKDAGVVLEGSHALTLVKIEDRLSEAAPAASSSSEQPLHTGMPRELPPPPAPLDRPLEQAVPIDDLADELNGAPAMAPAAHAAAAERTGSALKRFKTSPSLTPSPAAAPTGGGEEHRPHSLSTASTSREQAPSPHALSHLAAHVLNPTCNAATANAATANSAMANATSVNPSTANRPASSEPREITSFLRLPAAAARATDSPLAVCAAPCPLLRPKPIRAPGPAERPLQAALPEPYVALSPMSVASGER